MSDDLAAAEQTERALREQVGDLIRAKARADSEAARLGDASVRPGADSTLASIASDYREQSGKLETEIERARRSLREHEADLERLRAQQASS